MKPFRKRGYAHESEEQQPTDYPDPDAYWSKGKKGKGKGKKGKHKSHLADENYDAYWGKPGKSPKGKGQQGYHYNIESVQIPRGRVELYNRRFVVGPDDIALVRTTMPIDFISNKVMPVRNIYLSTYHFPNNFIHGFCLDLPLP